MPGEEHIREIIREAQVEASREHVRWGKDDCFMWVANVLRRALGQDPGGPYRGRYRSESGALRIMGSRGMLGIMREAAWQHHWLEIDPLDARTGHVGLMATEAGLSTVICVRPGWWCQRIADGITMYRSSLVHRAWETY